MVTSKSLTKKFKSPTARCSVIFLAMNIFSATIQTMDSQSSRFPLSSLWQTTRNFIFGQSLPNAQNDYISALPPHFLESMLVYTTRGYDFHEASGVLDAIGHLCQMRRVNRTFRDMLTNEKIAHILQISGARVDQTIEHQLFEQEDMNLRMPMTVFTLGMRFMEALLPMPTTMEDKRPSMTLVEWAIHNNQTQLTHILITVGAGVPQCYIARLESMGIDKATVPEAQIIDRHP